MDEELPVDYLAPDTPPAQGRSVEVNSSCRDCVFAVYDGPAQTDCRLGRIELFVRQGALVEYQHDVDPDWDEKEAWKQWDAEAEQAFAAGEVYPPYPIAPSGPDSLFYYHVTGRVCMACRNKDSDWAKRTPPHQWADRVREEMRLRLQVLVPVSDGDTLDDVLATAASLERQRLPASETHFLLNTDTVKTHELVRGLRELGPALAWNVRTVMERTPAGDRVPTGRCLDLVADHLDPVACNYYAVFRPGFSVPETFASDLDAALNDHLRRFILLRPTLINGRPQGLVVQTRLHRMVGGNREAEHEGEDGSVVRADGVQDKIEMMAAEDGVAHLICPAEELCPSLLA